MSLPDTRVYPLLVSAEAMALAFFSTWAMYSLNIGDCAWMDEHTHTHIDT